MSTAGETSRRERGDDAASSESLSPLRGFCRSAAGFWGRGAWAPWILSGILLLIVLLNLAASYGMNVWNRGIFDALQTRDSGMALQLSLLYVPLLAGSVLLMVTQVWARMTMQRRWRAWLNTVLVDRWLRNGRYYQLDLAGGLLSGAENPECRIADDVRIATEAPVEFATGVTAAVLSAATFIVVLWTVGGGFTLHFGRTALTVPGFLVFAAVIYAVVASGLVSVIGRRLIVVLERKDQAEAEYRYMLTRVRENGEGIALLHGEDEERRGADAAFHAAFRSWRDVCVQTMRITIISQTTGYVTPILPIILCAPKFLDSAMTLGEVMQAASAFTMVQSAFNWLIDNYPRLAEWAASARRVGALRLLLDARDGEESRASDHIWRSEARDAALRLCRVSVALPDGTAVINGIDVAIMPGEKVLIAGDSGCGKSILARALAGAWPWGRGDIGVRAGLTLTVLPQRPYLPMGALRRAVAYPDAAHSRGIVEITEALEKVGLGHLAARLEEHRPWDQILSGGEQQRLAFARLLLQRPDIIVLDEATAALDAPSQKRVIDMLAQEFQHATIVSIGHRPELADYHDRRITLAHRHGGARIVTDTPSDRSTGRAADGPAGLDTRLAQRRKPA